MSWSAEKVAASLSKPQKDAILRGSIGDHGITTVRSLIRKGLMDITFDSPCGTVGSVTNTERGNRVRAYLKSETP